MSARRLCVYCREREVEVRHRPFCSERCRMADLGRWLGGDYRIATEPTDAPGPQPFEPDDEGAGTDR